MGRVFVINRNDNKILVFGQSGEYISSFDNGNSLREPRGISFELMEILLFVIREINVLGFFLLMETF